MSNLVNPLDDEKNTSPSFHSKSGSGSGAQLIAFDFTVRFFDSCVTLDIAPCVLPKAACSPHQLTENLYHPRLSWVVFQMSQICSLLHSLILFVQIGLALCSSTSPLIGSSWILLLIPFIMNIPGINNILSIHVQLTSGNNYTAHALPINNSLQAFNFWC